jgi:hypothetical protein
LIIVEYATAPYLSFEEAMLYTELDRDSLRALLDYCSMPRQHISRRLLDGMLQQHTYALMLWAHIAEKSWGGITTLAGVLRRCEKRRNAS